MKILLAEDDPLTLEALSACLEEEGFQTLSAADGKQALDLWTLHRPQVPSRQEYGAVTPAASTTSRIDLSAGTVS